MITNFSLYNNIMEDLSFENVKNGNWYVIPGHYSDEPARIYKTIYHDDCYIKAIAPSHQQDIVKVPCNENIFQEPMDVEDVDDQEDDIDDEIYLEIKEQNQYANFISYDPNEHLDLDDDEKLELYNIFIKIEEELQKGGGRKKKRNIFTRKSRKNKKKGGRKKKTSKKRKITRKRKSAKKRNTSRKH
jgi:hypothetical protein